MSVKPRRSAGADKIGKRCTVRTEASAICHGVLRMRGGNSVQMTAAAPQIAPGAPDVLTGVEVMERAGRLPDGRVQAILTFRNEDARAEFAQAVSERGARLSA